MISFKKILSHKGSQIVVGPKDFWLSYFEKNFLPANIELIEFTTTSNLKERLEPNFFQLLNSTAKIYIVKNGEEISSKNWPEIEKATEDQRFIFLLESSSQKQVFPKSFIQNLMPYKDNKVLYIKEYSNSLNRNLSPNQIQLLVDSCDHFYEVKNFINLMDLFYGASPINDELEKSLSENTSTNNEFKICELLLLGNKSDCLKLIHDSRNLNFFSVHALLNKLAYNSFMAVNYPNLIPDWIAKKATRSPWAVKILKKSMEHEWSLKNSPINEVDGFIAFVQKL